MIPPAHSDAPLSRRARASARLRSPRDRFLTRSSAADPETARPQPGRGNRDHQLARPLARASPTLHPPTHSPRAAAPPRPLRPPLAPPAPPQAHVRRPRRDCREHLLPQLGARRASPGGGELHAGALGSALSALRLSSFPGPRLSPRRIAARGSACRREHHHAAAPRQVGAYYDAVVLSARNAFLPEMLREAPGFLMTEIAVNWNHPNSQGHYYLAELIVRFVFAAAPFLCDLFSARHVAFVCARVRARLGVCAVGLPCETAACLRRGRWGCSRRSC